ncbi:hypothetical protein [Salinarchaeum laminariae]|uniref:hypothetical protein n=1 Tax=Salinarchaeum laminariae TaxID=869888 RepID=UPI0020BDE43B|nr:hypothetical protein [Salinarchaeum laminariae]
MYLVEIKATARRHNAAVGETINRTGARHEFDDRNAADEWARTLSADGEHAVWIQDAPPHARGLVDGYLMSRGTVRTASAPFESEQRDLSTAVDRR